MQSFFFEMIENKFLAKLFEIAEKAEKLSKKLQENDKSELHKNSEMMDKSSRAAIEYAEIYCRIVRYLLDDLQRIYRDSYKLEDILQDASTEGFRYVECNVFYATYAYAHLVKVFNSVKGCEKTKEKVQDAWLNMLSKVQGLLRRIEDIYYPLNFEGQEVRDFVMYFMPSSIIQKLEKGMRFYRGSKYLAPASSR